MLTFKYDKKTELIVMVWISWTMVSCWCNHVNTNRPSLRNEWREREGLPLQSRIAEQKSNGRVVKRKKLPHLMELWTFVLKKLKPFFLTLCSKMLVYLLSKNNISFETLPQCNILTFFNSWPSSSFNNVKLMENKWAAKWVLNCNAVKFNSMNLILFHYLIQF